ncbi:MAG TPA: hypothetical protein PLF78_08370 [Caulobacter sp.]|nr:hypothetical protein [Caulobacter sp.]
MRPATTLVVATLLAVAAPLALAASPTGTMTWRRAELRPGVSIAGYDINSDSGQVAASLCRDRSTCVIAVRSEDGNVSVFRPPANTAWREPRFQGRHTLLIVATPGGQRLWSTEQSSIARLDLRTGRETPLVGQARFISSMTPVGRAGVCFAEATGFQPTPIGPKPVRFALRCIDDLGRDRTLGRMVFNAVHDLAHDARSGSLLFNGAASAYGGETPAFLAPSRDGPPQNMLAAADLTTGAITLPVSRPVMRTQWFAGLDEAGRPLLGRGPLRAHRLPLGRRGSDLSRIGAAPGKMTEIAGLPPGVVRPWSDRGLLLVNDVKHGAGVHDLAWIDFKTGSVSPDPTLTDALIAATATKR